MPAACAQDRAPKKSGVTSCEEAAACMSTAASKLKPTTAYHLVRSNGKRYAHVSVEQKLGICNEEDVSGWQHYHDGVIL